jgi:hypothetical protein
MGKFSAFAVLLVIAISIYFLNPDTQVHISTSQPENFEAIPAAENADISGGHVKTPTQIPKPVDTYKDQISQNTDNN